MLIKVWLFPLLAMFGYAHISLINTSNVHYPTIIITPETTDSNNNNNIIHKIIATNQSPELCCSAPNQILEVENRFAGAFQA